MGEPRAVGNQMVLMLDGREAGTVAYLAGGRPVGVESEEEVGVSLSEIRRRSALEVEPFVVQVGVLRAVTGWIDETLAHHHARREFELRQGHGDKTVVRHAHVGLLTEVGFPLLDRRSSGQAFLKLKVQPERITVERKSTPRRNAPPVVPLSGSSFRFSIDGVLDGTEVQRVEAFSIKVGTKKRYIGEATLPQFDPTRMELPSFTVHLPGTQSKRLKAWSDDTLAQGGSAKTSRTGQLELFARGGTRAMTLELADLSITSVAGAGGAITRAVVHCGQMSMGALQ
ncbi:MAG: hypothetical protein U1F56_04850 [Rubrivivax sp.]